MVDNAQPLSDRDICPVLDKLRSGPAWWPPAELAYQLSLDKEALQDQLLVLDQRGMIQFWEHPVGLLITLSPYGASCLGVKLTESATETFWVHKDSPEPKSPPARRVVRDEELAEEAMGWVGDTRALPVDSDLRATLPKGDEFAFPMILLGLDINPFPTTRTNPCPGCYGKPLRQTEYCVICDSSGLGNILGKPPTGRYHYAAPKPTFKRRLKRRIGKRR